MMATKNEFQDVHKSLIKLLLHWYNSSMRYSILIYFSRNDKIDNKKIRWRNMNRVIARFKKLEI